MPEQNEAAGISSISPLQIGGAFCWNMCGVEGRSVPLGATSRCGNSWFLPRRRFGTPSHPRALLMSPRSRQHFPSPKPMLRLCQFGGYTLQFHGAKWEASNLDSHGAERLLSIWSVC